MPEQVTGGPDCDQAVTVLSDVHQSQRKHLVEYFGGIRAEGKLQNFQLMASLLNHLSQPVDDKCRAAQDEGGDAAGDDYLHSAMGDRSRARLLQTAQILNALSYVIDIFFGEKSMSR